MGNMGQLPISVTWGNMGKYGEIWDSYLFPSPAGKYWTVTYFRHLRAGTPRHEESRGQGADRK